MRYYIHSSLSLTTSARGILLDESQRLLDEGHEVYFSYCNGLMDLCFLNPEGDTAKCNICKRNYKNESKLVDNKITFIPLNKVLKITNDELLIIQKNFKYESIEDIKSLKYENINIGLACLSTYISITRNLNPLIDDNFKIYFDSLISNCIKFYLATKHITQKIKPDIICVYNGRFIDDRPLFEFALNNKIYVVVNEGIKLNDKMYKLSFNNATSHSISNTKKIVEETWEKSKLSEERKIEIGSSFYEKKRASEYTNDKVYTKLQKENYLPEDWNDNLHNIVIFNSSEDEFAAIGGDFDNYALFESQIIGLEKIFNYFQNDTKIHFYLRIHPNLSKIIYKYHKDLELFDTKFKNVTVLKADSAYNSYSLLDKADTIVTFGSTMGIEAVYWNKPTILLSGSLYYLFGCCYIPKTEEQLWELLKNNLVPKDNFFALKYGFYYLNEERSSVYKLNYNFSFKKIPIIKKSFAIYNHLKFLESPVLYSVNRFISDLFYKFRAKKKFIIPTKENS